jgi:hypothetical protein
MRVTETKTIKYNKYKDIPSWQRTEPMTMDEARQRTRNWIRNSTSCRSSVECSIDPPCIHTSEWIEAEAIKRMENANRYIGWSSRLGDLMSGISAIKAGRILDDAGLRDGYGQPSESALAGDAPLAAWVYHHGYQVTIWNVNRVRNVTGH